MPWNRASKWTESLVNNMQTKEERQAKYKLVKQLGGTVSQANRWRDCHWTKIFRLFGLPVRDRRVMWDKEANKLRGSVNV